MWKVCAECGLNQWVKNWREYWYCKACQSWNAEAAEFLRTTAAQTVETGIRYKEIIT